MKIKELKISNILSFKYYQNIDDAEKITFDDDLNILIGENGAGKSTALEVINFLFKRVLFTQFSFNQDLYSKKETLTASDRKQILNPVNNQTFSNFRLDQNWNFEDKEQKIQLSIELDAIDKANIKHIIDNSSKLNGLISRYSNHSIVLTETTNFGYTLDVTLNKNDNNFSVKISPSTSDSGYLYLVNYNYYKELINLYNFENPHDQINTLYESFALIGGYRNYHSFNPSVSLQSSSAVQQIQKIRNQEYSRSLTENEQSEPAIFNMVRLRIAGKHYEIYGEQGQGDDCENAANNEEFLSKINEKLKLVNLEVKIQFTNKQKWEYSFHFFDLKRKKPLTNINSLSAGQKAIIHLVFEAYGRGDLNGGVVIIDEPEIHLHYQFQNEYLKVIEDLNKDQNCQYILVTHSESLINSVTIHKVKRFALDTDNYTSIKDPDLTEDQRLLVKILDNTRSTYAFFSKKVILVEGETDRYFFKAMLQAYKPEMEQSVCILDVGGKGKFEEWKGFFDSFGLDVYFIGDLDNCFNMIYTDENPYKLKTAEVIAGFKCTHPNLIVDIEEKYKSGIYILKDGDLEHYLDLHNKKLPDVIDFCNTKIMNFVNDGSNSKSQELRNIFDKILK